MRNPRRARNLFLLVALFGASLVAISTSRGAFAAVPESIALLVGGLMILIGAIHGIMSQFDVVRRQRLLRGEDILARWTVDPSHKDLFFGICFDKRRAADQPVDVIIAQTSLMADGDFHALPKWGATSVWGPVWIESSPPCLEFHLAMATKGGSVRWTLKIPVPPGAERDARRVHEFYNTRHPERRPDLRRARNIALMASLIGGLVFAVGFSLRDPNQVQPAVLLTWVIGALVGGGGLLLALLFQCFNLRQGK